jgi:hypothetical protein
LDALGGIQFQVPNGWYWDYRPGHNNGGGSEFKSLPHPKFDPHEWSRVEILVNAKAGTARMAVAQPVDSKAVEVLDFNEPSAGKEGPREFYGNQYRGPRWGRNRGSLRGFAGQRRRAA